MTFTYVFPRGYDRCILNQLAEGSKLRCSCPRCLGYVKLMVKWLFAPQPGKNGILIWGEPVAIVPVTDLESDLLPESLQRLFLACWTHDGPRSLDCELAEVQPELGGPHVLPDGHVDEVVLDGQAKGHANDR